MTDMKRLSVSIPEDISNALYDLRKTDEYVKCSYAELIRVILRKGLNLEDESKPA